MRKRLTTSDAMARIADVTKVTGAERIDVEHLVKVAGLDPTEDFRFENWSGVSFARCDLRGFDFTGARLIGCDFTDAQISAARFDQAELGRVIHRHDRDPHAPAEIPGGVTDLRKAADFNRLVEYSLLHPRFLLSWPQRRPLDTTHLPLGTIFSDAPGPTPEMVVVPGGEFWMGWPDVSGGDQDGVSEEGPDDPGIPRDLVLVPRFAIGRFAVTFEEWDAAQAHPKWAEWSGIPARNPNDHNWGRGRLPVIDVSWKDATAYCKWLNRVLGLPKNTYRLPSNAEWEHVCRAGTKSKFWWGNEISTAQANYNGDYAFGNGKEGEYRQRTAPVDSFEINPWGLYQVHGNVWEWCETAYSSLSRVVRGGSWVSDPGFLGSSIDSSGRLDERKDDISFRVARSLPDRSNLFPLEI